MSSILAATGPPKRRILEQRDANNNVIHRIDAQVQEIRPVFNPNGSFGQYANHWPQNPPNSQFFSSPAPANVSPVFPTSAGMGYAVRPRSNTSRDGLLSPHLNAFMSQSASIPVVSTSDNEWSQRPRNSGYYTGNESDRFVEPASAHFVRRSQSPSRQHHTTTSQPRRTHRVYRFKPTLDNIDDIDDAYSYTNMKEEFLNEATKPKDRERRQERNARPVSLSGVEHFIPLTPSLFKNIRAGGKSSSSKARCKHRREHRRKEHSQNSGSDTPRLSDNGRHHTSSRHAHVYETDRLKPPPRNVPNSSKDTRGHRKDRGYTSGSDATRFSDVPHRHTSRRSPDEENHKHSPRHNEGYHIRRDGDDVIVVDDRMYSSSLDSRHDFSDHHHRGAKERASGRDDAESARTSWSQAEKSRAQPAHQTADAGPDRDVHHRKDHHRKTRERSPNRYESYVETDESELEEKQRQRRQKHASESPPDTKSGHHRDHHGEKTQANGSRRRERSSTVSSSRPSPEMKQKTDPPPPKGILKQPTEKFPEDPNAVREGVAPLKDARRGKGIPEGARWTKISRALVNPASLEGYERYEVGDDYVIVLRVLSREEVQAYARKTAEIREKRYNKVWEDISNNPGSHRPRSRDRRRRKDSQESTESDDEDEVSDDDEYDDKDDDARRKSSSKTSRSSKDRS